MARCALSIASVASPKETLGARLNDNVTDGYCPWWLTASGVLDRSEVRKRCERDRRPVVDAHVNILQRVGAVGKFRSHFHDHVILVQRLVHDRHLALAKGVVEGVVDVRRRNAQPRTRCPDR